MPLGYGHGLVRAFTIPQYRPHIPHPNHTTPYSEYVIGVLYTQAEDDCSAVDLEKYLGQVERPFEENVTR